MAYASDERPAFVAAHAAQLLADEYDNPETRGQVFQLVNAHGTKRAELGADNSNAAQLVLFNAAGQACGDFGLLLDEQSVNAPKRSKKTSKKLKDPLDSEILALVNKLTLATTNHLGISSEAFVVEPSAYKRGTPGRQDRMYHLARNLRAANVMSLEDLEVFLRKGYDLSTTTPEAAARELLSALIRDGAVRSRSRRM